jgi:hypothetical protein
MMTRMPTMILMRAPPVSGRWVVGSPVHGPACSLLFGSMDRYVYRVGHCGRLGGGLPLPRDEL